MVIGIRQRLIIEIDGDPSDTIELSDDDEAIKEKQSTRKLPSKEAMEKLTDYSEFDPCCHKEVILTDRCAVIPYLTDEQANAVTKNPHLKLLFRLLSFAVLDDSESFRVKSFQWER